MNKSVHSTRLKRLQSLLRETRIDAGLRQIDLADRLGLAQSFISKYESGDRCLDLLELEQVCAALDIGLSEFVHRYEEAT
jgi:transcriptional regulator with XRE-family HTH domain